MTKNKSFNSIDIKSKKRAGTHLLDLVIYLPSYLFLGIPMYKMGAVDSITITGMTHQPIVLESSDDKGVEGLQECIDQVYQTAVVGKLYSDNLKASNVSNTSSAATLTMATVVEVQTSMRQRDLRSFHAYLVTATPELADLREKIGHLIR